MDFFKSKTVLVILVLIIVAIVVSYMEFPDYSTEDITKELTELCSSYTRLCEQKAGGAAWEAFAKEVQERTKPIVEDMRKHSTLKKIGNVQLHQLARYELPRAAGSKGSIPPAELEKWLKQSHDEIWEVQLAAQRKKTGGEVSQGFDWVTLGIVLFDVVLLGGFGYTFLAPVEQKKELASTVGDKEAMLGKLDRRIAEEPMPTRYRAMRAKLLLELGRREEALPDVDWILEEEPHGVDLTPWWRLRESLAQELAKKESNPTP